MRGKIATGAGVLLTLGITLCGFHAAAQDGPYDEVRGWSLYRNDTNCSAFMVFDNDEAVGFTYDAPGRSTRVTFSNADAETQEDGDTATLDVLLRRPDDTIDRSWTSTVFLVTVADDGRRTLSSRWLGPPSLEDFRNAAGIGFFDGDREIGSFSLRGTAAALDAVKKCSAALRDAD